ncbi:hypothetical protein [Jiella pelagia]|uniref:Uncharacterized protein n=1 Tax=Jiella pelagia TaxID=2986949 RepID=A0ABY7BZM3_9HYPH|nr:hypothetical protein [Jiella pelagia]WAP69316.1 hypothetical protein OH818_03175 [Jiella pelagia]
MRSFKDFAEGRVVASISEFAERLSLAADAIRAIGDAIKNPEQAWTRFVDAAIAQLDRLVKAIDESLGGALTKFGFIGEQTTQANEKAPVATGSKAKADFTPKMGTSDYSAYLDRQMAAANNAAASGLPNSNAAFGSVAALGQKAFELSQYLGPIGQIAKLMGDVGRTVQGSVEINTSDALAKLNAIDAKMKSIEGRSLKLGGSGAVASRPSVATAPAAP